MKKIFAILLLLIIACQPTLALSLDKDSEIISSKEIINRRKKIQEVGYRLLNANGIDKRVCFEYARKDKTVNSYAYWRTRKVAVTKGMMDVIDNDDELAYVLGHEISHVLDFYRGPVRGFFSFTIIPHSTRRVEYRSDRRGMDFMVKAGYNPVASIVVSNKFMSQPRFEALASHPLASKRLARMYAYIYRKYPYFLVNNEYKNNPVYQNFLLTSKVNRIKLQKALEEEKRLNKVREVEFK